MAEKGSELVGGTLWLKVVGVPPERSDSPLMALFSDQNQSGIMLSNTIDFLEHQLM